MASQPRYERPGVAQLQPRPLSYREPLANSEDEGALGAHFE